MYVLIWYVKEILKKLKEFYVMLLIEFNFVSRDLILIL